MKEMYETLKYEDKEYILPFNLNVMEIIQDEYGSIDRWGELTDGSKLNKGEVNVKALVFGLTAMINEGIEITNEENGTDIKPFTHKQVGRIVTEVGLQEAIELANEAVIDATNDDDADKPKNV
jgi:hypothetical protein